MRLTSDCFRLVTSFILMKFAKLSLVYNEILIMRLPDDRESSDY